LGGEEAYPLSAEEDEAIFTGAKEGKHKLTLPQLRSPVQPPSMASSQETKKRDKRTTQRHGDVVDMEAINLKTRY